MTEESSLAQVEPLAPDHGGPKAPGVNVSSGKPEITFNEAPATHDASKPDAEDDDDEDEAFDTYNTQSLSSLALHNATDVVDRLYKLSYRIRNPATRLGFSKALQFRQDDPETGRELIKEFEEQDLRHVQEIFAILQGKPAAEIARDFLVKRLAKSHSTIVLYLVARKGQGVHIDAQDREGQTALAVAADRGNIETVRILLDGGADPLIMDFQKRSARSRARENECQAVLELLDNHVNENKPPETIPTETHGAGSASIGGSVDPEKQSVPGQTGETESEARGKIARRQIKIDDAFDDALGHCEKILKRNQILIDYYIYPTKTPTQIADYEPIIKGIQSRIKKLQKLDYSQLKCVINDPDCLAASYLEEYVQSLDDALYGIKKLFIDHYDPKLADRSPYDTIPQSLADFKLDLQNLPKDRRADRDAPAAEQEIRSGPLQFCRGAVQLINNVNKGEFGIVSEEELLEPNRKMLTKRKGVFCWWRCSRCEFRVRYHLKPSQVIALQDCDEIRKHDGAPLSYRPVWLAKSHLRQPNDGPVWPPAKYGCLFCYGEGKKLGETTCFATEMELAMHVCSAHKTNLPPPLLLNKLNVAVDERLPETVRWDLKLHTR